MNQVMIAEKRLSLCLENNRGESPPRLTTDEVATTAARLFQASHYVELQQLNCDCDEGVISLYGQVSSFYLKQIAQETLRELPGVIRILNHLEVAYDPVPRQ